jgi:hypothetical protein
VDTGYYVATTVSSVLSQNEGQCRQSLREFISSSNYAIYSVAGAIEVVPVSESALIDAWTADISRFAMAAFETMATAQAPAALPRSLAWLCIKAYYAAYFAAHTLLRLSGVSLTTFAAKEKSAIRSVTYTYLGTAYSVTGGVHAVTLTPSPASVDIKPLPEDSSHLPVWRYFGSFIDEVLTAIATLPTSADVLNAINDLSDLQKDLRRIGGPTELSTVRNDINYQQMYEVWYPYGARDIDGLELVRIMSHWLGTAPRSGALHGAQNDALAMTDLAIRIVHLCRSTITAVASLNTGNRSFLGRRAQPLLNLLAAV